MASMCRYFRTARGCRYGDQCRFVHDRTCRFFKSDTGCRYGASCRFSHSTGDVTNAEMLRENHRDGSHGVELAAQQAVETAMAGLSMNAESSSTDAEAVDVTDVSLAAVAAAGCSSTAGPLHCIARDAAAAKSSNKKKKRSPRNGNRKASLESKSKELVLYDHQTLKCGECGMTFVSGADNTENLSALHAHYVDKLGRADHGHLKFVRRHSDELEWCFCGACGDGFARPVDLFRHLGSKTRNKSVDSHAHAEFFEAVVVPFVERDSGYVTSERVVLDHLNMILSADFMSDSDFDIDDDDDDDETGLSLLAFMMLTQGLRGSALYDSDSDDDDIGMFGFSSSDVDELLCQGIKPWDDCAPAALAVLHGDDEFY